jgi:hypothetical protein
VRSAEAAWLHEAVRAAGYRVAGCTGSAWMVTAGRARFTAWTTAGAGGSSDRTYARLGGVAIRTDGTRLAWPAQGLTVWLAPGDTDHAATGALPGRTALAWLAVATRRLPRVYRPIRLVPTPAAILDRCRSDPLVRAACPTRLPELRRWQVYPRPGVRGVFGIERGAEAPERPELNRPPALVHVELARGLRPTVAWPWPDGPLVRARDGLLRRQRPQPLLLGRPSWNGRHGELALAPAFPAGGSQGNHLVFRWRQGGAEYVLGLHAWEPLSEAVATLRRMVGSLPAARAK